MFISFAIRILYLGVFHAPLLPCATILAYLLPMLSNVTNSPFDKVLALKGSFETLTLDC